MCYIPMWPVIYSNGTRQGSIYAGSRLTKEEEVYFWSSTKEVFHEICLGYITSSCTKDPNGYWQPFLLLCKSRFVRNLPSYLLLETKVTLTLRGSEPWHNDSRNTRIGTNIIEEKAGACELLF